MEKMLVTQALNEIKTLDARINREIKNGKFITSAKTIESKVTPATTKEKFIKDAKSAWDSVNALIDRREKIKSAIVESNAKTNVEICGIQMSVAKAIDMKNTILYKKNILDSLKLQLATANNVMDKKNAEVENKIDNLVTTAFGKESKTNIKPEDYDAISKPYRTANEYSLVDPLNVQDKIYEIENYIEEFESTVDQKLQVSNCITVLEF